MPKISVIMPVYNTYDKDLREAIDSILNQTYSDFEFIIINDGSANNAEEVILSYQDSRIKYVKNEQNLKLIATLNKGLDLAQGEYIPRMDSDDISDKTRFEKQMNILENNKNIGLVGTGCVKFPKYPPTFYLTENEQIKNSLIFEHNAICGASSIMRKSIIDDNNLRYDFKYKHAEDYAMWLKLMNLTEFHNINEILYFYRWHNENVSKAGTLLQSINAQYLMIEAQGEKFNIDCSNALAMLDKMKNNQKITSDELKAFEEFVMEVNKKIQENKFECNYSLNRIFYKTVLKTCKRDINFLKILWKSKLNKFANIKFWTKVENTLKFF